MDHNYVRSDDFCILTINRDKKSVYRVTGNVSKDIAVGDTINYIVNEKQDILAVSKVIERRDDKSFPKGNNLFFSVDCIPTPRPEPTQK